MFLHWMAVSSAAGRPPSPSVLSLPRLRRAGAAGAASVTRRNTTAVSKRGETRAAGLPHQTPAYLRGRAPGPRPAAAPRRVPAQPRGRPRAPAARGPGCAADPPACGRTGSRRGAGSAPPPASPAALPLLLPLQPLGRRLARILRQRPRASLLRPPQSGGGTRERERLPRPRRLGARLRREAEGRRESKGSGSSRAFLRLAA